MSEPHTELLEIADALDQLAERSRQPGIREPLRLLEKSANDAARAWSRSWLGYHAHVYYAGLRPPPPGAHFSQEYGLKDSFVSDTTGEWEEFDPKMIEAAIYERAGDPDLGASLTLSEETARGFETHKFSVLSLLESVGTSGSFIERLAQDVDKLQILDQSNVLRALRPSRQFVSNDMVALNQGLWVPPHITVLARALAALHPFDAVEQLAKLARRAGSHLSRRQRQVRRSATIGTNVFIGHGHSPIWRELKDFIEDRLQLPVDEFNSHPVAGVTNITRLSEMLDAAAFAFLVMTGEDEQPDGQLRARMNVIHEAGLFQGKLGFARAIVVLEDGCEEFSNITGLGQIRFPRGNIRAAFEEIREVLEREGVSSVGG